MLAITASGIGSAAGAAGGAPAGSSVGAGLPSASASSPACVSFSASASSPACASCSCLRSALALRVVLGLRIARGLSIARGLNIARGRRRRRAGQPVGVEPDDAQSGRLRAGDVVLPGVADHDDVGRLEVVFAAAGLLQSGGEEAGLRLAHAHVARRDDVVDQVGKPGARQSGAYRGAVGVVGVGGHDQAVAGAKAAQSALRPRHRPHARPLRHRTVELARVDHQRVAPVEEDHGRRSCLDARRRHCPGAKCRPSPGAGRPFGGPSTCRRSSAAGVEDERQTERQDECERPAGEHISWVVHAQVETREPDGHGVDRRECQRHPTPARAPQHDDQADGEPGRIHGVSTRERVRRRPRQRLEHVWRMAVKSGLERCVERQVGQDGDGDVCRCAPAPPPGQQHGDQQRHRAHDCKRTNVGQGAHVHRQRAVVVPAHPLQDAGVPPDARAAAHHECDRDQNHQRDHDGGQQDDDTWHAHAGLRPGARRGFQHPGHIKLPRARGSSSNRSTSASPVEIGTS